MKKILVSLILLASTSVYAGWKSDSEVGYVSQSGNAEQQNAYVKTLLVNDFDRGTVTVDGSYINASGLAAGTQTTLAESAYGKLQYNFSIGIEKLSPFASILWEKNRFAGFDNRYSADLGFSYLMVQNDTYKLVNETGYRFRRQYAYEVGSGQGPGTDSQFIRLFFGADKILTKTSTFKFYVETLYDLTDSENIEINFEPSLNVAVGEFFSSEERPAQVNLSVGYKGMFDNVPALAGLKRYDSILTTGLKVIY